MVDIQLEIEGDGAIAASQELSTLDGITASWEPVTDEPEREGTLAAIATIVGIVGGSITIAEKLHGWYQARQKHPDPTQRLEKVILVGRNGQRVLLSSASVEQIRKILDA
jgi:hypothetical protein